MGRAQLLVGPHHLVIGHLAEVAAERGVSGSVDRARLIRLGTFKRAADFRRFGSFGRFVFQDGVAVGGL